MVELHESLKGFDVWREVAQLTEKALQDHGWNYTVAIRAMGQLERELQRPNEQDVHVTQEGDRFAFAFDANTETPTPGSLRSIKKWVDIQIIDVIDQFIAGPDDLDYADNENEQDDE